MTAQPLAGEERGVQHEAFLYDDDASFVAGVGGFVREGVDRGELVVVAEPARNIALLRDALGADASAVEFVDMAEIGANPARIIGVWETYVEQQATTGRTLRGVGEPAFAGRGPAEYAECEIHELLLNYAFPEGDPWRLICPYDTARLPEPVVAAALRSHPIWWTTDRVVDSQHYDRDFVVTAFGSLLIAPEGAQRTSYGLDVDAVRRLVGEYAAAAGLPPARVADVVLAGHELAANTVRYGGGSGVLSMWRDGAAVVFQFEDRGFVADPLVGRTSPELGQEGGRGLFLVNQLCDFVELRSSELGTTVRITNWVR